MNQKDYSPGINRDREGHPHQQKEDLRSKEQPQALTEVKNAHATGDGTLSRSDEESVEEDDERGKVY